MSKVSEVLDAVEAVIQDDEIDLSDVDSPEKAKTAQLDLVAHIRDQLVDVIRAESADECRVGMSHYSTCSRGTYGCHHHRHRPSVADKSVRADERARIVAWVRRERDGYINADTREILRSIAIGIEAQDYETSEPSRSAEEGTSMRASGEKPCPAEARERCVAGSCPDERASVTSNGARAEEPIGGDDPASRNPAGRPGPASANTLLHQLSDVMRARDSQRELIDRIRDLLAISLGADSETIIDELADVRAQLFDVAKSLKPGLAPQDSLIGYVSAIRAGVEELRAQENERTALPAVREIADSILDAAEAYVADDSNHQIAINTVAHALGDLIAMARGNVAERAERDEIGKLRIERDMYRRQVVAANKAFERANASAHEQEVKVTKLGKQLAHLKFAAIYVTRWNWDLLMTDAADFKPDANAAASDVAALEAALKECT